MQYKSHRVDHKFINIGTPHFSPLKLSASSNDSPRSDTISNHILILTENIPAQDHHLIDLIDALLAHSSYKILIRYHPDERFLPRSFSLKIKGLDYDSRIKFVKSPKSISLDKNLSDAYFICAIMSNAIIKSLLSGIPVLAYDPDFVDNTVSFGKRGLTQYVTNKALLPNAIRSMSLLDREKLKASASSQFTPFSHKSFIEAHFA